MTKDELINSVQKEAGGDCSKRLVGDVINETFKKVSTAIKKSKRFSYPDFGTFTVRKRKART